MVKLRAIWQSYWQHLVNKHSSSAACVTFKWRVWPLRIYNMTRDKAGCKRTCCPCLALHDDNTTLQGRAWRFVCIANNSPNNCSALTRANNMDLQHCADSCQLNCWLSVIRKMWREFGSFNQPSIASSRSDSHSQSLSPFVYCWDKAPGREHILTQQKREFRCKIDSQLVITFKWLTKYFCYGCYHTAAFFYSLVLPWFRLDEKDSRLELFIWREKQ